MGDGKYDEMKGRAKQAVGDVTDDDELRREGKRDELGGKVKQAAEDAKESVDEGVDRAKEKLEDRS